MPRKIDNDEFKIAAAKLVRQQGYSLKKAARASVLIQLPSVVGSESLPQLR